MMIPMPPVIAHTLPGDIQFRYQGGELWLPDVRMATVPTDGGHLEQKHGWIPELRSLPAEQLQTEPVPASHFTFLDWCCARIFDHWERQGKGMAAWDLGSNREHRWKLRFRSLFAELCVCQYLGTPFLGWKTGKDGGVDFTLGPKVGDVKHTDYLPPALTVTRYSRKTLDRVNVLVLTFWAFKAEKDEPIRLCGWLPRREFQKRAKPGHQQGSLAVPATCLERMPLLLYWAQKLKGEALGMPGNGK